MSGLAVNFKLKLKASYDPVARITIAYANRRRLLFSYTMRGINWVDGDRTLVRRHAPCVVCSRRTRWAVNLPSETGYPRCCSRACYRTRFEA